MTSAGYICSHTLCKGPEEHNKTSATIVRADELAAAKQRLTAVLADPRLRLPDVVAEVLQLAGGDAAAGSTVLAALGKILTRSDPAFKVHIILHLIGSDCPAPAVEDTLQRR